MDGFDDEWAEDEFRAEDGLFSVTSSTPSSSHREVSLNSIISSHLVVNVSVSWHRIFQKKDHLQSTQAIQPINCLLFLGSGEILPQCMQFGRIQNFVEF